VKASCGQCRLHVTQPANGSVSPAKHHGIAGDRGSPYPSQAPGAALTPCAERRRPHSIGTGPPAQNHRCADSTLGFREKCSRAATAGRKPAEEILATSNAA
jgi:hypothetical protein